MTGPRAQIRLANIEDVLAILAIYNEAIATSVATFDTQAKTLDQQLQWFHSHTDKHPVFVCEVENQVVGWASLNQWSDRCAYKGTVENSIYIFAKHRGQGYGNLLLETLLTSARENKLHTILARISDGNEASIYLHEKFGFSKIGVMREVGFKFGRWIDVQMMQLML